MFRVKFSTLKGSSFRVSESMLVEITHRNPDRCTTQDLRVGTPTQFQPPVSYR